MKVLITGGSQGIGLAIAKELYKNDHELFLVARDEARLKSSIQSFQNQDRVNGFACDISDSKQIEKLLGNAAEIDFSPDVIILNAAYFGSPIRSVIEPLEDELRKILEVNLISNYRLVKEFVNIIKESMYPRIIIIGSTASIRVDDGSLYGISKWALKSYTYNLRNELKDLGIGVTLLNPGGTFTEKRIPNEEISQYRLLETSDIGKLVSAILTLSPQAVVEELNIRPMLGDTY